MAPDYTWQTCMLLQACSSDAGAEAHNYGSGRNCIWLYEVDPESGLLTLLSQNIAKRLNDGPRHVWPHPNGRIVYSLQEHSSVGVCRRTACHLISFRDWQYVDVLALSEDGKILEWMQGVDILPEGTPCDKFWADGMVRPSCRGLS